MKLLDRYIASRYISRLLWSLSAATVIFLVVNNVDNLDTFIDNQVPVKIVLRYYYLFIPYIVYLTLPMATLLATLFTIGGLTQTNELTAIQASGVSFRRPVAILLSLAAISAAGILYLGETVVPVANRARLEIERYDVRKLRRETRANLGRLYFDLGGGRQLYIGKFVPETREAYDIRLVTVDSGRVEKRVLAEKMCWLDGEWRLQGASALEFKDSTLSAVSKPDLRLKSDALDPASFSQIQTAPEEMNYRELKQFIDRLAISGGNPLKWEVELLFKVSLPVAAVVIVLFGAPIAAVRRRSGTALAFGLALLICFIYFGFMQVGKVLGQSGNLNPIVSAWVGNAFFGTIGLILTARSRR